MQASDPLIEQIALGGQVAQRICVRIVEQGRDLLEWKAQLPVGQHLVQALDVTVVVHAISRGRAARRGDQTDLVVMVQRPHTDTDETGDHTDGEVARRRGISFAHADDSAA
ncbi:Uncharacterised protein [Mycobacteroides abscessus subsp. abscessus]|nr:Uncharacterised protein [Mycobacteroides abscessus subsp. abscessus]